MALTERISSRRRAAAYAVHAFTASGAIAAMLSMLAAAAGDWTMMFAWLGLTLVIDGADGPLARLADTHRALPRFSGDIMDWVIDYITYVFIPAFVLLTAPLLPDGFAWAAAAAVLVTGAFYFSDTSQKTDGYYFRGFPAVWNIVLLYLFLWDASPWFNLALVLVLAALTFVPIDFVHPTRVKRWRTVTLAVTLLALILAVWAVAARLEPPTAVVWLFTLCGAYGWAIGLYETYEVRVGRRRNDAS